MSDLQQYVGSCLCGAVTNQIYVPIGDIVNKAKFIPLLMRVIYCFLLTSLKRQGYNIISSIPNKSRYSCLFYHYPGEI